MESVGHMMPDIVSTPEVHHKIRHSKRENMLDLDLDDIVDDVGL